MLAAWGAVLPHPAATRRKAHMSKANWLVKVVATLLSLLLLIDQGRRNGWL